MQWESWSAFWHMGGHAWFVWGSYGLTVLLIAAEIIALRNGRRVTISRLLRLRRAAPGQESTTVEIDNESSH